MARSNRGRLPVKLDESAPTFPLNTFRYERFSRRLDNQRPTHNTDSRHRKANSTVRIDRRPVSTSTLSMPKPTLSFESSWLRLEAFRWRGTYLRVSKASHCIN